MIYVLSKYYQQPYKIRLFLFRYIRGLYYTWKGFQKRHNPKWARFYLTKQILIDADIALLRVFDCFMDSGSQVVLQLYIMLRLGSTSMKCKKSCVVLLDY